MLFGKPILSHLFGSEYAQHSYILVRLMIAGTMTFVALGLGFVMTAARSLRPQVPLLLVTGMVAAGASAFLIPRNGLIGAADAVLIASLVQLAGTGVILLGVDRRFRRTAVLPGVIIEHIQGEAV